jgi:glycerophosphoryl diester phosphodiesterase
MTRKSSLNERMLRAVRVAPLLLLAACSGTVPATKLPRAGDSCDQVPEPHRWIDADVPDVGARPPLLSAHRGGVTLAPENTLAAYRHAFAYEMDFIEVDVRETADGVFVAMHDKTVDRTTNGSGFVSSLSWAEIQSLNAADFAPWQGSEYDPSPVPRLEQVLELARSAARGIEFDVKSIRNPVALFDLVASYGLMSRSFFSLDPQSVQAAQAHNPEIRVIFNVEGEEPADALFAATRHTAIFGSRRIRYSPEKIAAIHDGCAFVLPHSYDASEQQEVEEFQQGLAAGADGAQVNQPDIIAAAAQRRVPAELIHLRQQRKVCLRNTRNGFGLPRRSLKVRLADRDLNLVELTDRDGCITLPLPSGEYVIRHEDSPAVRGAELRVRPAR